MSVFEEFLNLLIPSKCVLCSRLGSPLCQTCQASKFFEQRLVSRFDLNGFAVCEYSLKIAALIHEFKENSQTAITKPMAISLAKLIPTQCKILVPMPSKQGSFEKRGFNPAKVLANAISREVAKNENRLVEVCDVLSLSRDVYDQAALSGQNRRINLLGSMVLKTKPKFALVWLVDDIVTTGATLHEAARCLRQAGIEVGGFLVFAETLPKNLQKAHGKSV